jgi:hypothetical protein
MPTTKPTGCHSLTSRVICAKRKSTERLGMVSSARAERVMELPSATPMRFSP